MLTVPGCRDTHTTWKNQNQGVNKASLRMVTMGVYTFQGVSQCYLWSTAAQLYRQIPGSHVESCFRHSVAVPATKT